MWILRLRVPKDVQQIQQQLAVAQESTRMVAKGEGDQDFRQTAADICTYVTESAHEGNTFFNPKSELAWDPRRSETGAPSYESRIIFCRTSFPLKNDMYE